MEFFKRDHSQEGGRPFFKAPKKPKDSARSDQKKGSQKHGLN